MIVATALIYLGLNVTDGLGPWRNRLLSSFVVLMGLAGLSIMGLMVLNYLAIRQQVDPAAASAVQSTVIKTVSLGALYAVFLIPAGILGFRVNGPRDR